MKRMQVASRAALTVGVAGAFLVLSAGGPATAGHGYEKSGHLLRSDFPSAVASDAEPVKVTRVADGIELEETSQGAVELRIEELAFQPGATLEPDTMQTAFICEMVEGEIEAMVDGAPVRRGVGEVWACPMERLTALPADTGAPPATMRVIHVIPQ